VPPLTPGTVAAVVVVSVATVALATLPPALQGARSSTIRTLTGPSRQPRRSRVVLAASARMPVPVLLGLRFAARQPRRGLLATASLILAVATVVATMTMNRDFAIERSLAIAAGDPGSNLLNDRLRQIVYVLRTALLLLAALNTVLLAWTSVLDTARPTALVRALGATPRQGAAGLAVTQLLPALAAALIGIPGGLALFRVASNATGGSQTSGTVPPLPWLLAVVPATPLATAAITVVPTRLGARHPVVAALRYE
jgi:putative ABC transport system permease protein